MSTRAENEPVKPKKVYVIPKVSPKMIEDLKLYRKKRDKYMKKHPVCEYPECGCPSTDLHHGAGRVGKLLLEEKYFKALCRGHHNYCEEHPVIAQQLGLSFKRLDKSA